MELKLPIVKNKANQQFSFSLPKKKLTKEMVKDIGKNKYIRINILK